MYNTVSVVVISVALVVFEGVFFEKWNLYFIFRYDIRSLMHRSLWLQYISAESHIWGIVQCLVSVKKSQASEIGFAFVMYEHETACSGYLDGAATRISRIRIKDNFTWWWK